MNNYKLLFTLLLTVGHLYGQKEITIVDNITNEPIPYVNIYFLSQTKGTYSNEAGKFIVPSSGKDTLYISSIGYKKNSIAMSDVRDTLRLFRESITLDEIIVSSKSEITLGYHQNKGKYLGSTIDGLLLCQLIVNQGNMDGYISQIHYNINRKKRKNAKLRAHIFSVDSITKKPSKELLSNDIIIDLRGDKLIASFNVEHQKIHFPLDGVYIGLEWVGEDNETSFGYLKREKGNTSPIVLATSLRSKNRFWAPLMVKRENITARFGITIKPF